MSDELIKYTGSPQFPAEYLTDTTGWLPDQNRDGEPYGCTNYASTKLARILGFTTANPFILENVTHANENGGYGVLASIDAARKVLNWFSWRYTIQTTAGRDYFDTFRLAQVSGLPERRAISVGTPWPPSWEEAALNGVKILPMPTPQELAAIKKNPNAFSWHNYVADGWSQNFTVAPGQVLYRIESHQGPTIDYLYLTRPVLNVVMDLYGTIGVLGTDMDAPAIARVPLPDWFWSFVNSWLGLRY